jgi:dTDP-4-dehydrorhamnose 3,5-epimerase
MSRFTFSPLPLSGLQLVVRQPIGDARGSFTRLFCADELREAGWTHPIAQINHTITRQRGAVRGMHFQHPPHAEMKLVTYMQGAVWDVAVDLRKGSPTFLHWHGEELSADNHRALLIPEGFAHGFQTLSEDCELLYLHSAPHTPSADDGLNPTDPRLEIAWPLPISQQSDKDAQRPHLTDEFQGLML